MDPLDHLSLQTLIVRCQMGERPAMEQLFLRFNGPLAYYLRRMIGRDEVDDVRQEVWVAVLRRIAALRSPAAFVVWFYQVARSKAADRMEGRKLMASFDESLAPADPVSEDEPSFTPEDAARIHGHLNALSPEHREALVLRFMEDLSYEQIAEVVGCNAGTVRSRLHYAKLALRRLLENES